MKGSIGLAIVVIGALVIVSLGITSGFFGDTGGWTWYGSIAPTSGCWMKSETTCQGDTAHADSSKVQIGDHILVSQDGRGFSALLPEDGYDACQVKMEIYINSMSKGSAIAHGDYINHPFSSASGQPYGSCRVNNAGVHIGGIRISDWSDDDGFLLTETVTFYDYDPNENPPEEEFECVADSDCDWYCQNNPCNTPTCIGEWACVKDETLRGECFFQCNEEELACYTDANCAMGEICHENECIPAMDPDTSCYTDAECSIGYMCDLLTNECKEEPDSGAVIPPSSIPGIPAEYGPFVIIAIIAIIFGAIYIPKK